MMDEETKEYVNTMFAQMGGNRFLLTTGCRILCGGKDKDGNPFITFKIPRSQFVKTDETFKVNPTHYKITLNLGRDTYTVKFSHFADQRINFKTGKVTPEKRITLYSMDDVYCDQLQDIFERQTGLLLDFCRVTYRCA